MRRVDKELGRGVWQEPDWRDEPYRNPALAALISWHELRLHYDLLETFPKYTREYYLEHGMPMDDFLKCVYHPRRLIRLYNTDSPFLSLIRKSA